MPFIHNKCGGIIENRTCRRCGRHWNPLSYRLSPMSIRLMTDPKKLKSYAKRNRQRRVLSPSLGKTSYAGWGNRIPGLSFFASRLPNWPRWARVLSTVIVLALVVLAVILIWR